MTILQRTLSVLVFGVAVCAAANADTTKAELTGAEIFERDKAAWLATDAATVAKLTEASVRGWLVIESGDSWLVRFVSACEAGVCAAIDVLVDVQTHKSQVTEHREPQQLSASQMQRWRARETAIAAFRPKCKGPVNVVILDALRESEKVKLVYMLRAAREIEDVMVGGHQRTVVSWDGETLLAAEPLSKSCLALKATPDARGVTVTHLLDDTPSEIHVFLSLTHDLTFFVSTSAGLFSVEAGKIQKMDN